jgi:mannose-6-phosphate isomerase
MHLFEAFIAAYKATFDSAYLDLAGHVYELFENYFFEKDTGTLLEFFEVDWSPDTKMGDLTEPGHMMEWCWLLHDYGQLSGKDVSVSAERLYAVGCEIGTNKKTGLLINEAKIHGRVTNGDSRCGVQTEYIKANVARARAGYAGADAKCAAMINKLFENFLIVPEQGGWHDQRNANGDIISKDMPSSTFYHLFCAAVEVHTYMREL